MERILRQRTRRGNTWQEDIKNGEQDKMNKVEPSGAELPPLPDFLTLAKILWMSSKSKYHHVILMALLLNELGFISRMAGLL